jgi:thiol:disulfide interchange protein
MSRIPLAVAAATLLAPPPVATAQGPEAAAAQKTQAQAARPSIYDEQADARAQVEAATALARRDARRVLVMFGGDWCGWCHKLHGLFQSDPAIRDLLAEEYVLVLVDTRAPRADALLAECKGDLEGVGFPFLAVLDGQGAIVTRQETNALEEGDHHDPARVKAFLETWVAPRAVASEVVAAGLARASSEDKRVLLHFGAPWCGWCHKLEGFLGRAEVAAILARDFVDVKVDTDRMTGGQELLEQYRAGRPGGIPWFAFLDAEGNEIVTSDGPTGNIGYPVLPGEIGHFLAMLKQAARRISPEETARLGAILEAEAEAIQAARSAAR